MWFEPDSQSETWALQQEFSLDGIHLGKMVSALGLVLPSPEPRLMLSASQLSRSQPLNLDLHLLTHPQTKPQCAPCRLVGSKIIYI